MIASALAGLAVLLLQAEDDLRLPVDLSIAPAVVAATTESESILFQAGRAQPNPDLILNAAVHGRFSIPFGTADRDVFTYAGGVFIVDQKLSWGDLFHPGWGLDLEVDVMFGDASGKGRMRSPGFDYGAFVAVMVDEFSGGSVSDDQGNFIRAEPLAMATFLVGGKFIQTFEQPLFADARFGLGAVHYSAVEATFGGPGVTEFHDELFRDTWTFALDLRGHGGVRLGPLAITLGLGFRLLIPPDGGARVSLDSGPLWVFDVDLGVELGF